MIRNPPSNPWEYGTYYDAPDGNRYLWDPDYQCWYQTLTQEQYAQLSHWQKYSWIYVSVAIILASIYFVL